MKKGFVLSVFAACLFVSCSSAPQGNFRAYLKGAGVRAASIRLVIGEVAVHKAGGNWTTVSATPRTVDLVRLAVRNEGLVDAALAPGDYDGIHLLVTSARVTIGGRTSDLSLPNSDIRIQAPFSVVKGRTTDVLLDYDADESIAVRPPGSGESVFRPVFSFVNANYY